MSSQWATDGKLGVLVSRVDDPTAGVTSILGPAFTLGTEVATENRGKWVYIQLPAITQIGSAILINPVTWVGVLATTTNAAAALGSVIGIAPAIATAGQYGWVQTAGVVDNMFVLASTGANLPLNTTATAGALDASGTSGSVLIPSLTLTTARGGTNGVAPGFGGNNMNATHA